LVADLTSSDASPEDLVSQAEQLRLLSKLLEEMPRADRDLLLGDRRGRAWEIVFCKLRRRWEAHIEGDG
jgi:hypothetical protein